MRSNGPAIIRAAEILDGDLLTDFLDAVEPNQIQQALEWVTSARSRALRKRPALAGNESALQELRAVAWPTRARDHSRAWHQGWDDARLVRDLRHSGVSGSFANEDYISLSNMPGDNPDLRALGAGQSPVAVVNRKKTLPSTRFTMARALWHCIWDEAPGFAVTSAYTYRQAVEHAFAAEPLAPAQGIAQFLGSPQDAADEDWRMRRRTSACRP